MAAFLYRDIQMECDLRVKISNLANRRYSGAVPMDVQERIATEIQHICDNGYGTLLAAVADLAEFSTAQGYPVGIRGLVGNLYIAHLLGIAANDPLDLGIPWEGFLGLDGTHVQHITLNVADEMLNSLRARLREILPECDVLFGPGIPHRKIAIVPRASGVYDPDNEYLSLTLCTHELMSRVGQLRCRAADTDAFGEDLIVRAYREDVYDIPVLGNLDGFQDLANMLEPKSFSDLIKVLGLAWTWKVQFQAYRTPLLPDRFTHLVGTREDINDICVQHGISRDDAFRIMQQAVCGQLTPEYKDMLIAHGFSDVFLKTLDAADYLYPRGQCADYLYWALTLLAHEHRGYRM